MSEPEPLSWQYCRNGYDITSQPLYAEQDADEIRAWDGDFCAVSVVRDDDNPQHWRINSTDGWLPDDADEHTFTSPAEALDYLTMSGGAAGAVEATDLDHAEDTDSM
jgi:hypothetical protein